MAQAGTLDVGINVDPTGMIRGFGKTKQEIQKFERGFKSSTRSMGSAFTNMAVDFAASGEVGARGLKRMAESAVGLAGVFGPHGLLISAVVGAGVALWNWHDRARDEAKKTEEAYRKLTTTFSVMARMQAVAEFDIDPDRGGKLTKAQQQIEDMRAELLKFGEFGKRGLALGPGGKPTALSDLIAAAEIGMQPLVTARQRLVDLVTQEANTQQRIVEATDTVAAREKSRLTTMRQIADEEERLAKLRASGPAFRESVTQARIAARTLPGMPSVEAVLAGKLTPTVPGDKLGDQMSIAAREAQAFADSLQKTTGAQDAAIAATNAFGGALMSVISRITGGSVLGGIGAAAGGDFLSRLVSKQNLGKIAGPLLGSLAGPVGAIAGGLLGKAVGGIGKLFGFGKKGPSPEEEAAKQLRDLARSARRAAEELNNIPTGFKVTLDRFLAVIPSGLMPAPPTGGGTAPAPPPGSDSTVVARGGMVFTGPVYVVANDPDEMYRKLQRGGHTIRRGGVSDYQVALTPAV